MTSRIDAKSTVPGVSAESATASQPIGTPPPSGSPAPPETPLRRVDLGEVPYAEASESMATWVEQRREGRAPDRLFLLTHPEVITYGTRTPDADVPPVTSADGTPIPIVPVDRGGLATYHGPGQLVGYLVLDVKARGPVDIVRWVERGLVRGLARLDFDLHRRDTPSGGSSLVGVWSADDRKVVSIGMRIRRGISSHGFSVNVDPDLGVYDRFVACGMPDARMTSLAELAAEQGRPAPTMAEVRDAIAAELGAVGEVG